MLGYVKIQFMEKGMFRRCRYTAKKINKNEKLIEVFLGKKFDKSNDKDIKKVINIFRKQKLDTILFEKVAYNQYQYIIDSVYANGIKIITGNTLYINMVSNVIEHIFNICKKIKIEEIHLGIALDLISYNKLELIKYIANRVRSLTILTTATSKFDNINKEVLEKSGLVIKCTDNFKVGLKECNVCVNLDFDNSKIISSISNKCIYINCNKSIDKMRKAFKGIIVNDINLDINDLNMQDIEINNYRSLAIAQAIDFDNVNRKIISLVGVNGDISKEELENFKIYKGKK